MYVYKYTYMHINLYAYQRYRVGGGVSGVGSYGGGVVSA